MKRLSWSIIVSAILAGCAGSTSIEAPPWTPEAPQKIGVTIELPTATSESTATATDEPTFTPIPATFTLEPTATHAHMKADRCFANQHAGCDSTDQHTIASML
jgi:hypothetical protein